MPLNNKMTIRRAPVIYVAGPMAGLRWGAMNDWREEVEERMPDCEIRSPTRGKDWIKRVKLQGTEYEGKPFGSVAAIVKRDHWDVKGADLMIANFLYPSMVSIRDILKEHRIPVEAISINKEFEQYDVKEMLGLDTEKVSLGTATEYGFAHAYHTPVIAIMRQKSIHRHVFTEGISLEIVQDLDTAIFLSRKLLNLPDEPALPTP